MTTINTQSPIAPATTTPAAAPAATAAARAPVRASTALPGDGMGYSNAEAFRILMRAGQTGRDVAARLRSAANKDEICSKQTAVKDTAAQVRGEQTAAMTGLASKLAGAGVSAYAGGKGTAMRRSDDDATRARGAALDSASQGGALGNVVTSAGDLADKMAGGAHEADQAKIALKQNEVQASLAAARKEAGAQGVSQADKAIDAAIDMAKDMRSRLGEVISKLTGG